MEKLICFFFLFASALSASPLWIQKNPNPQTLLAKAYADTCPAGFEASTEAEAKAWVDAQLAAGWTAAPAPAEVITPQVPAEVGAGQIRAAMIASGIAADDAALDTLINSALDASISNATQRAIAKALWAHGTIFKRDNAFVAAAKVALNKTDAEIDALFILAATF